MVDYAIMAKFVTNIAIILRSLICSTFAPPSVSSIQYEELN